MTNEDVRGGAAMTAPDRRIKGTWLGAIVDDRSAGRAYEVRWEHDRSELAPRPEHWLLALAAPYTVGAGEPWDDLWSGDPDRTRRRLTKYWGVQSRRTLLAAMHEVFHVGHRWLADARRGDWWTMSADEAAAFEADLLVDAETEPAAAAALLQFRRVRADDRDTMSIDVAAWDFVRYAWLAHAGAAVGMLTDDEAVDAGLVAAVELRGRYESWAELGASFIAAHRFLAPLRGANETERDERDAALMATLLAEDGPWAFVPWELPLPHAAGLVSKAWEAELGCRVA